MINRNSSSRLLIAVVLTLIAYPELRAQDDATVPSTAGADATASHSTAAPSPELPLAYTVVHGDTLASIAHRYGMTLKQLKRLNNLPTAKARAKPGEVLQVVWSKRVGTATAALRHDPTNPSYPQAQPVQDFDLGTSPSGSRPTDLGSSGEDNGSAEYNRHAPVAKLVSPQELADDQARRSVAASAPAAPAPEIAPPPVIGSKHQARPTLVSSPADTPRPAPVRPALPSLTTRSSFFHWGSNPVFTPVSTDWGSAFLQQARALGSEGIGYDDDWRPPGEPHSWAMDCSNTTRYLYKVTAGITLPRTASDQYYYLHLQNKAWDVPQIANGLPDGEFLRRNLKPGDLLFWENTYRPERQPPITHVMVFLGTNERDQWIMAGSQTSRGGEHNRRNGGPDVYVFRPSQPCGGYTTWLGLVHHRGRFCAFGRPLEADRSKLAVAADD